MTTREAEALYAAQHVSKMSGRKWAVYNPHNKPLSDLPYIYGFNNGGYDGWYSAQLIAQDGMGLGSHICSAECYMEHDLGILEGTREDRHETFKKHYPDGYRMKFIPHGMVKDSKELDDAYKLNQALAMEAKELEQ